MATKRKRAVRADGVDAGMARVEAIVRLVISVVIVGLMIWLIIVQPVLSDNSQMMLKALMALAFATLMGSLAGEFKVKGNPLGLGLRASGAFAVFVFVWYTLPKIVPAMERRETASVEAGPVSMLDVRTMETTSDDGKRKQAPVALTIPTTFNASSQFNQSLPGTVVDGVVQLRLGNSTYRLPWLYFVHHMPLKKGSWLSSGDLKQAQSFAVVTGHPEHREIMFASSPGELNWEQLVKHIDGGGSMAVSVSWSVKQGEGVATQTRDCAVSGNSERSALRQSIAQGRFPARITVKCDT